MILVAALAAIIGDNVGYEIGKRLGPRLFKKPDSILLRKENLARAEAFLRKARRQNVIMARFVPYIRTLAPVLGRRQPQHAAPALYAV